MSKTRLAETGNLHFPIGTLHAGYRLVTERIVLVSGGELFHRTDITRPTRRRLGRVIDSFLELREGDHVVHLAHGIGKYRGLKLLEQGHVEEHLEIEFSGATKIYVPSSNIELVQKYVGGSKGRPTLAHVGGKTWLNQKAAAQRAVLDLGRRDASASGDSRVAPRHRLSRRHPMAARFRRSVSLPQRPPTS